MKPDIVFLDLEGTLIRVPEFVSEADIPASMWSILARMLGEECYKIEEDLKKEWLNNPAKRYLDWMDESVKLFKQHGLNKAVVSDLLNSVEIYSGVVEFCAEMKEAGARIAIVTGAIKNIAEYVQIQTRADHLFAGCELYYDGNGEVLHWNLLPSDYKGKHDFMCLLINEYKADPRNCVFIGDGYNDLFLAKEVGLSIAFNAHEELKKVATYVVDQPLHEENFMELGKLIIQH